MKEKMKEREVEGRCLDGRGQGNTGRPSSRDIFPAEKETQIQSYLYERLLRWAGTIHELILTAGPTAHKG